MIDVYEKSGMPGTHELVYTALGGLGGIGSNLYLYGHNGKWLIVDFGIGFVRGEVPGVDVIMPDIGFIEERLDDVVGMIITHAHEDHLGAIPYMYERLKCPIYTTKFTAEFAHYKLAEADLTNHVDVHVVESGTRLDIGGFDVEFVAMTHSIPEPQALKFHMPFGAVLHTGDWKIDAKPMIGQGMAVTDLESDAIFAVIGDSTNVMTQEYSESEGDVRDSIMDLVASLQGGVAVTCFASNVARVESFMLAAKACNRKVVLVGRSLWRMLECAKSAGYLQDVPPAYEAEDVKGEDTSRLLYLCTGSQGEWRAGLARIARNDHRDVRIGDGDTVIFSARSIPGNEIAIGDIQNMLVQNGADIITARDAFVHASGHGSALEISDLYTHLKPRFVLPMHGEYIHLQRHAQLAKKCGAEDAFMMRNGDVMSMTENGIQCVDEIPTGVYAVDGDTITAMDSSAIRQRRKMGFAGLVVVSVVLDGDGSVLCEPQITAEGVPLPDEKTRKDMVDVTITTLENMSDRDILQDSKVVEKTRACVGKYIVQHTGKKPFVKIHILRTDAE